ncbi:MAG TPA: hypothetical protein VF903_00505 [Nitrospirota bacterium]
MRDDQVSRSVAVFLSMLLAVALLNGCGNSNKKSTSPAGAASLSSATTVGINVCIACHTAVGSVETAEWLLSKHANLDPGGTLYSAGAPTIGQVLAGGAACRACHDPNGDSANITAARTIGYVARPVIGCEACHGPGSLHSGSGPISLLSGTYDSNTVYSVGTASVSGQFLMCTTCHQLLDSSGTTTIANPAHLTTPSPAGAKYVITDTHFATPGNFSGANNANVNDITGYAMDYASQTVCTDCHNPHKNADINKAWANSDHADKLAADAWAHYNWTCDAANCGGSFGDRATCQRCHTATGFAAYADSLGSGNAALAGKIWTGAQPPLAYNANFKPEMLECRGCHTDNRGHLRNPRAYQASYKIPVGGFPSNFPINANVLYQYPDVYASNVCMPCHTGRGSGKAVQNLNTGQTATVDFSNMGFPDGHYLTGGGTMFKGTPYEYAGRGYPDPATFMHNRIGTPAAPGTGTKGPCIGCHMDRTGMPGNHLFEPISAESGALVVTSEVCFTCHAGSSVAFGAVVQTEKDNYGFALQALEYQLLVSSPSYSFTTAYPYFSNTNWLIFGDTDKSGNSGGKNTMGAAFNFSMLYHEPGAYVHNSRYVKRIIYDSLDWLDDGQMNYSVGGTINAICTPSLQPWCTGAKSYLLYGAPGTSDERP